MTELSHPPEHATTPAAPASAQAALRQLAGEGAQALPHAFRALSPAGAFGTAVPTRGLPQPHWVAGSDAMARELGLADAWRESSELLNVFAGNLADTPSSAGPLTWASVYSGHQFGQWAGQLGDGRAHSLGCVQDAQGQSCAWAPGADCGAADPPTPRWCAFAQLVGKVGRVHASPV